MMDNQKTAADWYATMRESNERNFKAFFEIGGDNDLLHSENRRCDTEIIQQAMDSAAKAEREKIATHLKREHLLRCDCDTEAELSVIISGDA